MRPDHAGPGGAALALAAALALLAAPLRAQGAPPDLAPGDVVALAVAGLPDLTLEAEVQGDGLLSLPRVGEVPAAGRSLAALREEVRGALAGQVIPVTGPDGTERLRAVDPAAVALSVARWRPVYVEGAVAAPGAVPFRPGLTLRQAVAAAGGPVAPMPAPGAAADPAALRGAYGEAWYDAAGALVAAWRLRVEDGAEASLDAAALPCPPDGPGALAPLAEAATRLAALHASQAEAERAFLDRSLGEIDAHLAVLRDELEAERGIEAADAAALAAATDESRRGLYTAERIEGMRGAALTSATRRLQTQSALMQLERRRGEVARDRERLGEDAAIARAADLAAAELALAQARARLDGLAARLAQAGLAPSGGPGAPALAVSRGGAALAPDPDLPLGPGDVVTVAWTPAPPPAAGSDPAAGPGDCPAGS